MARVDLTLLKTWSGRRPGHVFKGMPSGVAKTLVTRGIGEIVAAKKPRKRKSKAKSDDSLQSESNDRTDI